MAECPRALRAVLVALPLLVPIGAAAQYPRAQVGRFEVRGMDFRPDGAWRMRVNAVRAARHQFLRSGSIRSLNLGSTSAFGGSVLTGHFYIPVVPISFSNQPSVPYSAGELQNQLFAASPVGEPYSLKTFYEQLSARKISMDGQVFPWVVADSSDAYYEDGCNGIAIRGPCAHGGATGVDRFAQLLVQALSVASNGANALTAWAQFDNDGPDGIPNSGDDDGVVDFVTFLQADKDGACGTPHIWAHRFVIAPLNGGSPFVTRTPWAGHPGQFLKVNDYTMQSAVGGPSACDATRIMPIGTVAHETGHAFGLPDLYDTSPTGWTEGIGEWGLMGSGNYATPSSPSRMEAWSLLELGWVTVDSVSTNGTVRLDPVTSSHKVLYIGVPNTDEYFLLENRQDLETDSAQMNPALGSRAKQPGLLVWHIDQGQVDAHGFRLDNNVNVGPVHGVELVQADGQRNLDAVHTSATSNRGDAGDTYPGSTANRQITLSSNPGPVDNQNHYAGFVIDSIFQVDPHGQVIFRFLRKQPSFFAPAQAGALIKVNGGQTTGYNEVLHPGDVVQLSADSLQSTVDASSRFEFRSWSDNGALSHAYTAGAAVDTITATFASQFRVIVQLVNALPGAVLLTASPPDGSLATGVFLTGGTPATLTATPPTGTIFGGWTGDTTAANPVLRLPMNRPYVIAASFVAQVEVSVEAAANLLLGTGTLTAAQTAYLDARGNRNGVYDLGDFLAFARFSGVTPSAGVVQRILAKSSAPASPVRKGQ